LERLYVVAIVLFLLIAAAIAGALAYYQSIVVRPPVIDISIQAEPKLGNFARRGPFCVTN
jgi:hypothetical protein